MDQARAFKATGDSLLEDGDFSEAGRIYLRAFRACDGGIAAGSDDHGGVALRVAAFNGYMAALMHQERFNTVVEHTESHGTLSELNEAEHLNRLALTPLQCSALFYRSVAFALCGALIRGFEGLEALATLEEQINGEGDPWLFPTPFGNASVIGALSLVMRMIRATQARQQAAAAAAARRGGRRAGATDSDGDEDEDDEADDDDEDDDDESDGGAEDEGEGGAGRGRRRGRARPRRVPDTPLAEPTHRCSIHAMLQGRQTSGRWGGGSPARRWGIEARRARARSGSLSSIGSGGGAEEAAVEPPVPKKAKTAATAAAAAADTNPPAPAPPLGLRQRSNSSSGGGGRNDEAGARFLPNVCTQVLDRKNCRRYGGQFSSDGRLFYSTCQDATIRVFDTSNLDVWTLKKEVPVRHMRWTVSDTDLSPDGKYLVYSSLHNVVHVINTGGDLDVHEPLDLAAEDDRRQFGLYCPSHQTFAEHFFFRYRAARHCTSTATARSLIPECSAVPSQAARSWAAAAPARGRTAAPRSWRAGATAPCAYSTWR